MGECTSRRPDLSEHGAEEGDAQQTKGSSNAKAAEKQPAPKPAAEVPQKKKKKKKSTGLGVDKQFPFVDGDKNVKDLWKASELGFIKKRLLGKGASCEVWHAQRKNDDGETENLAVKCMERDDKWNPILFPQEHDLLSLLKHDNILKLMDCYMDQKFFYVCTEMGQGGELFDHIKKKKRFSEKDAAKIIKVIIEAIEYCHKQNVVHRDLKPENIIYKHKPKDDEELQSEDLIVIDFGDAKVVKDNEEFEDFVGTAFYLAPECVRKRKGWELKKSDMWTIGVITYVLLTGRPPFYGKGNREILKKIIRGKVTFPASIKLSREAIDFVLKLLNTNTKDRFSATQALNHKWLTGNAADVDLGQPMLQSLANYSRSSKLKKVLIRMIANEMTDNDHKALKKEFDALDKDGNGEINLQELCTFIQGGGVDEKEAMRRASVLMTELDTEGKGGITFAQFSEARLAKELHNEDLIRQEFDRIDADKNGFISHTELAALFNWTLSTDLVTSMIQEIDKNNDGEISFEEFSAAMRKGAIGNALSDRKPIAAAMSKAERSKLYKESQQERKEAG